MRFSWLSLSLPRRLIPTALGDFRLIPGLRYTGSGIIFIFLFLKIAEIKNIFIYLHYKPKPHGAYRAEIMKIKESISIQLLAHSAGVTSEILSEKIIQIIRTVAGNARPKVKRFTLGMLLDTLPLGVTVEYMTRCGIPINSKNVDLFRFVSILTDGVNSQNHEIEN